MPVKEAITFQSQAQSPSSNPQCLSPRSAAGGRSQPPAPHLGHRNSSITYLLSILELKTTESSSAMTKSPCPCCSRASMLPSGPVLSTCRHTGTNTNIRTKHIYWDTDRLSRPKERLQQRKQSTHRDLQSWYWGQQKHYSRLPEAPFWMTAHVCQNGKNGPCQHIAASCETWDREGLWRSSEFVHFWLINEGHHRNSHKCQGYKT